MEGINWIFVQKKKKEVVEKKKIMNNNNANPIINMKLIITTRILFNPRKSQSLISHKLKLVLNTLKSIDRKWKYWNFVTIVNTMRLRQYKTLYKYWE